jgi:hypothetical protein
MHSLIIPKCTAAVPLGEARLCRDCEAIYRREPYCPTCGSRTSLDVAPLIDWTRTP